jgi:hypothetical protein
VAAGASASKPRAVIWPMPGIAIRACCSMVSINPRNLPHSPASRGSNHGCPGKGARAHPRPQWPQAHARETGLLR